MWGTHNAYNQTEHGVQLCWCRFPNKLKRSKLQLWMWSPVCSGTLPPFGTATPFLPSACGLRAGHPRTCLCVRSASIPHRQSTEYGQNSPVQAHAQCYGPSTPKSFYIPSFLARQPPRLASQLMRGKKCARCTHEEALRSHERAPSEFNINISAAFFQILRKNPGRSRFSLTEVCSDGSSAIWAPGGTRAIPPAAGTRVDQETKDGVLNKRLQNATPNSTLSSMRVKMHKYGISFYVILLQWKEI